MFLDVAYSYSNNEDYAAHIVVQAELPLDPPIYQIDYFEPGATKTHCPYEAVRFLDASLAPPSPKIMSLFEHLLESVSAGRHPWLPYDPYRAPVF